MITGRNPSQALQSGILPLLVTSIGDIPTLLFFSSPQIFPFTHVLSYITDEKENV